MVLFFFIDIRKPLLYLVYRQVDIGLIGGLYALIQQKGKLGFKGEFDANQEPHPSIKDLRPSNKFCAILKDVPVLNPNVTVDFDVQACSMTDSLGNLISDDFNCIFSDKKIQDLCTDLDLKRKQIINEVCEKCVGKLDCGMGGCIPIMFDTLTKTDDCERIEKRVKKSLTKIKGGMYR